jgi:hypothetical protein
MRTVVVVVVVAVVAAAAAASYIDVSLYTLLSCVHA